MKLIVVASEEDARQVVCTLKANDSVTEAAVFLSAMKSSLFLVKIGFYQKFQSGQ